MDMGVKDQRKHMMMVRKQDSSEIGQVSVVTILFSKRPFTDAEVDRIMQVSKEMEFLPVLTPRFTEQPDFERVASRSKYRELIRSYPLNIDAPTDDNPFFFHMLRAGDLLRASRYQGMNELNLKTVKVWGTALGIVLGLW